MARNHGKKPAASATLCKSDQVANMLERNGAFKKMAEDDPRYSSIVGAIAQLRRNAKMKEGTSVTAAGVHYSVGRISNVNMLYTKICGALNIDS